MNYQEANQLLTGRCKDSRKLCNHTYLQRRLDSIAVRLHSTDVIEFHPDGDVTLYTGGWNTVTTIQRINQYQKVARAFRERSVPFLQVGGWDTGKKYRFDGQMTIRPDGTVHGYDSDQVRTEQLEVIYSEWREQDRETNRNRYWIRKARGTGKTRLTVDKIMQEPNITVRMAQAHCYGLDRFLLDAKAKTLDTYGEYALLSLPMGPWQRITALKMTCPSTGAVYISPVDPGCPNVSLALDWYFNTPNYLETLKAES